MAFRPLARRYVPGLWQGLTGIQLPGPCQLSHVARGSGQA